MTAAQERLTQSLGYAFRDPALLEQALTHRSAGGEHNERLEYLGDAALGLVIAEALFQRLPDADEGALSRIRASLVKRETLAMLARELELGDYLRLGSGELKSGGYRRDSILADGLEAVFGAIYLDGGFEPCRSCIARLYGQRLEAPPTADSLKDPKTRLQEYLQGRQLDLPVYELVETTGEEHARHFQVECRIDALQRSARGRGGSRRKAEQAAARAMLQQLDLD